MPSRNYFGSCLDARRYARARPPVHRSAIEAFQISASIKQPFARALDVGCGTGQSTLALVSIAESVVGVDPSPEMLAETVPHPKIHYEQATAEDLPFPDGQFDLITAGLAFHWFDASAFLAEAHRLLRPGGWLVVYTSGFTGEMLEEPAFARWFRDEFLARYPTPARNQVPFVDVGPSLAEVHGFVRIGAQAFSNDVGMSVDAFIDYELSTTNIIAAAGQDITAFGDAEAWMRASLAPLFRLRDAGTFRFVGKTWALQKQTD